jgi:hypothetical protein
MAMKVKRIILTLGLAALLGGCDHPSGVATGPASQPVAVTQPPPTQPAQQAPLASLMIGGKQFWFPPAVLRLSVVDGKVNARLTTDDPKEALEPNYQGNSFDLEMPDIADDADWQQTNQGTWSFVSQTSQTQSDDSPHGIFLLGQAKRLYPKMARVDFSANGALVTVTLQGQFLLYDNTARPDQPTDQPFAPPQLVNVQGVLQATVPAK